MKGPWPQTFEVKGSRLLAPLQSYTSILERAETQVSGFHSISFALGSCSKERKWDRLARIDVARAWAAASTNMWKKSRWSMVRGPMTATMATLHDFSIIPASPWKWYPAENPDVGWICSGGDPGPFLSEMQQRLSHKVWEQAALHGSGKKKTHRDKKKTETGQNKQTRGGQKTRTGQKKQTFGTK